MNNLKSLLCFSLLLLFVVSAKAQDDRTRKDDRTRIGFGVGVGFSFLPINLEGINEGDFSSQSAPISFHNFNFVVRGQNFRLEPNFGYFSVSIDEDREYDNGDTRTQEFKSSNFRVGAVIAYATAIASLNLYYGINIGIILSSASGEVTWRGSITASESEDASKTDFFVGPAIGGEYMFSDNFSLGGEIQVNYITVGQFDWELSEGITKDDVSTTVITTNALVILRWYVN